MESSTKNSCCSTVTSTSKMSADNEKDIKNIIQYNVDSARGFEEAAQNVDNAKYKQLFLNISNDRKEFSAQLKRQCVESCGETEYEDLPTGRSVSATMHQWWLNIKASMTSDELQSVLESAEQGEDYIKAAYEKVLKTDLPSNFRTTLQQQYSEVKAQHDKVRDLRDTRKARKENTVYNHSNL